MVKLFKSEEGFTGLEAAIVLIAFVVVAAVFSYVVLGAGFFTTQKSQQVVYSSVDMASSSVEVLGDVYGNSSEPEKGIDGVRFVVGLTAGGSPVDFSNVNLVFYSQNSTNVIDLSRDTNITATNPKVVTPYDVVLSTGAADTWYIIDIANGDKGALLENQEQFTIYAKLHENAIKANQRFSLEINPPVGASYGIKRSVPAKIEKVNLLY